MGVANPQFGGWGGRMESEMGPLSSQDTTSYRLLIVTIGLSLTAPDVPDRQSDGIGLAKGGTMH